MPPSPPTGATSTGAAPGRFAPGTAGFTVVLAMAMATTALSIDTILPAFGEIRSEFGLPDDSTRVAALVTVYMLGSGFGLIPAGILSDRFGRRAVMRGGVLLYILGAAMSALAPSLGVMLVGRFIWGLGASGPRVTSVAMIRDTYEGDRMARQMSLVMAVFMIVPAVAPMLGAGIIRIAPWQGVFWACAGIAGLVFVLSLGLPDTLPPERRRALSAAQVWDGWRIVFTTPGTVVYLVAMTALFGVFLSFLGSSEIIVDEVFGLGDWFPFVFGGLAISMAVSMTINSRLVGRVGLDRMIRIGLPIQVGVNLLFLATALIWDGRPPFAVFFVVFALTVGFQQMMNPNLNAAAMRPLGAVAGTAAAVIGMIPQVGGAAVATVINRQFDGTITPLAIGFTAAGFITLVASRRAAAIAPPSRPPADLVASR